MFAASFPTATTVTDERQLNTLFGTDRLYLEKGGRVELSGEILLGPNVMFSGANALAGPVRIEIGSVLTNVRLGADTVVRAHSILSDVVAGQRNLFGPFCFIRDTCSVGNDAILGAHVEATRSRFADGVKISHRAFVGDATLGEGVIIGAGTVFCNYLDGKGRRETVLGDGVMVGSGTMLVAPLSIGAGCVIAAGSVVTKDLPADTKFVQKR